MYIRVALTVVSTDFICSNGLGLRGPKYIKKMCLAQHLISNRTRAAKHLNFYIEILQEFHDEYYFIATTIVFGKIENSAIILFFVVTVSSYFHLFLFIYFS